MWDDGKSPEKGGDDKRSLGVQQRSLGNTAQTGEETGGQEGHLRDFKVS